MSILSLANPVFTSNVFDIVESFHRHAFFEDIDNTQQKGLLLLNSKSPWFKYLPLATYEILGHISPRQTPKCLLKLFIFLSSLLDWPHLLSLGLLSLSFHYFCVILYALGMFLTHHHLLPDHCSPFLLFFLWNESLASISELCKDVLLHVIEHASHHLGLMVLQWGPVPPLLEAWRCGVSVVPLHIVPELFVSLFL